MQVPKRHRRLVSRLPFSALIRYKLWITFAIPFTGKGFAMLSLNQFWGWTT